ncbi:RdgB/HAM1 family non-canonical purine NTP pyrophosphatase [Parafrankia sp. FMc2]|uniref:RdgB/HAM1 family non-canonical purine NTP pyrophosphatase n=1 Tax=Parafrankia sp. FMc2 TaxID=3233196 RepID=UPI0034D50C19
MNTAGGARRPRQVVLASRNEGKLRELHRILAATGLGVEVLPLPDGPEVAETGSTFAENALIKARAAVAATGLAAIADDSGLTVDELAGMPGVRSARWAGARGGSRAERDAANNTLLLAQLDDVEPPRRGAAFVCAAALVTPEGAEHVVHGALRGRLLTEGQGSGGFGYDPLFVADGETRTNAELTAEEKDRISHRGKALRDLAAFIATLPPATAPPASASD